MRHTKIIATIGPAVNTKTKLTELIKAGMNVARLNFSHGTHEYFTKIIKTIRSIDSKIPIMLDTKSIEIRTGPLITKTVQLKRGQTLTIQKEKLEGDNNRISMDFPLEILKKGNKLLIDDGLIEVQVAQPGKTEIKVKVKNSAELGGNKTVTILDHQLEQMDFMTPKDREDILFGISQGLDFVAASFVRNGKDVKQLREFLEKHNSNMQIISKIEHRGAVKHIDEIIELSDAIMIARGDLGVELPIERLPELQRQIIPKCIDSGKPVIVATQVLESMRKNPRPTRAEVNDVANAILQGTDAIMLSGETASGDYPIESVRMLAKIARKYDAEVSKSKPDTERLTKKTNNIAQFISTAALIASKNLDAKLIITPTNSGFSARNVSRLKPSCPIIAITKSETTLRQLQLTRTVEAVLNKGQDKDLPRIIKAIVTKEHKRKKVKLDDVVIVTARYNPTEKKKINILEIFRAKSML